MMYKIKACHISSIGFNIRAFFKGQFDFLRNHGWDYTVVTSEPSREGLGLPDDCEYVSIPVTRRFTPIIDLIAIYRLYRLFHKGAYDLVQYTTLKGSILGSIAAFFAKIPVRLYLMRGAYYMGQSGLKRKLFKMLDTLICRLSTHIEFDGFQIRKFAINEGLCRMQKTSVIGEGSDNGVDTILFNKDRHLEEGRSIRSRYGIGEKAVVIGSVMRIVTDKGINELVDAFTGIYLKDNNVFLLLVGREEEKNAPRKDIIEKIRSHSQIISVGQQDNVAPYYAAMDIFSLPTYREGFSAVNLEAAAMQLPVVTTDIIGARDSIVDGVTGMVVSARDSGQLKTAILRLVNNSDLRKNMGISGRKWVEEKFEQQKFWRELLKEREELILSTHKIESSFGMREEGKSESFFIR